MPDQSSVTLPAPGQPNHCPLRWSSFKTKKRTSRRNEAMIRSRSTSCFHYNEIEESLAASQFGTDSHLRKLELSSRLMPQVEVEHDRLRTASRITTTTTTTQRLFSVPRLSSASSLSVMSLVPHLICLIGIILATSHTAADMLNQTTQISDHYFNSKQTNPSTPQTQINQQQNSLVSNTNTTLPSSQQSTNFLNRTPLMKQAPLHRLGKVSKRVPLSRVMISIFFHDQAFYRGK